MHKFILESFGFFKSCLQFLKILAVFSIVMLMLYWAQHLVGTKWAWFAFISPFLDLFVDMGQAISTGSVTLFNAVFEFKYFIAAVLYIVLYLIIDVAMKILDGLKISYSSKRATHLEKSDYLKYDYLVCMDGAKVRNTLRIVGEDKERKIHKLLEFTCSNEDVADPWYTGDFDRTYKDVFSGCKGLLKYIENRHK